MLGMLLKSLIYLPLILFIPGFLLFNILNIKKFNFLETLYFQILFSFLLSGWFGLILAELGYFSLYNLVLSLLVFSLVISFKLNVRYISFPRPKINRNSVILSGCILLAISLFFHPFEDITSLLDSGAYVQGGVALAKSGSLFVHDELLQNLDDNTKKVFYPVDISKKPFGTEPVILSGFHLGNFLILNSSKGILVPWYFHLSHVLFAIFYSMFGIKYAVYLYPLMAIFSLLSIYFFAKKLFSFEVGILSIFFYSISYTGVWWGRYISSEILFQLLIFSGLATLIYFLEIKNKFFGLLSAFSLGELLFTRIDAILVFIGVCAFFLFIIEKKRFVLYFMVPYLILIIHASLHMFMFNKNYLEITNSLVIGYKALVIPILLIVTVILFKSMLIKKIVSESTIINLFLKYKNYIILLFILIFFFYQYFVRPVVESSSETIVFGEKVNLHNELNLIKLSWYVGDLVIWSAVVGISLLLIKNPKREIYFFVGLFMMYSVIFLTNAYNNNVQPWWTRRFVTLIIPSMFIFSSYFIYRIKVVFGRRVFFILFTIMTSSLLIKTITILTLVNYAGLIEQTQEIAENIPQNSIVVFEHGYEISKAIMAPLHFIYGIKVASLIRYDPSDIALFEKQILKWIDEGFNVYYLNPTKTPFYLNNVSFNYFFNKKIDIVRLDMTRETFPTKIRRLKENFRLYQISKKENKSKTRNFYFIDVGGINDVGFLSGFYAPEEEGNGVTFRWTSKKATIRFPITNDETYALEMMVWAFRLNYSGDVNVTIKTNNNLTWKYKLETRKPRIIRLNISTSGFSDDYLYINIFSDTWIPYEYIESDDGRELGVKVIYIILKKM